MAPSAHCQTWHRNLVLYSTPASSLSVADSTQSPSELVDDHDRPPSFRELFKFTVGALPIYVSPTLLTAIDTAAVGQVSATQLAALGPACAICDGLTGLMVFISVGTTNAVSSSLGRGDSKGAQRACVVSQVCALGIGLVLAFGLWASAPLLVSKLASSSSSAAVSSPADAAMWAGCLTYVRIRALSFPAALAMLSAQAACLGAKDTASPTKALLLAAFVNVVGDWALTVRAGYGIAGAAWATVACQVVAAASLVGTLNRNGLLPLRQLLRPALSFQEVRRFFAFGGFIFVLMSKLVVYNSAVALSVVLGPTAAAAHQVLYALARVCYTMGDVPGATAQAFLPRYFGPEGQGGGGRSPRLDLVRARPVMARIAVMSACTALVACTVLGLVPSLLPGLFTADPAVAGLIRKTAPLAACSLLLHPAVVGIEGCLLATKDVGWLVSNYAVTGLAGALATLTLLRVPFLRESLNLGTVWVYMGVYQLLRSSSFAWRLATTTLKQEASATN